jgi:hypothetical protein
MSRLRSDKVVNKAGTGAPELTYGAVVPATGTISGAGGINVTGVITATSFSGDGSALTGIDATALKDSGGNVKIQANAAGSVLSGVTTATTLNATTLDISGNATIDGNLTVSGTQTIIDTATLSVEDANIGIGSVSNPSNTTADGAGLTVFGGSDGDKTLKWLDTTDRWTFAGGALEATAFHGDGSNLTGVISGVEVLQGGSSSGTAITALNFSGATVESDSASGISTITIAAAGLGTEATVASGAVVTLDLSSAQDHKVTATGICTITCSGGTEGESHTVRIINSGSATVGFSTYFLFPSGSTPSLPAADGTINLISFTVNRVGAAGTQLLAGASLNFS